ncbi:hypothetical protein AgCh_002563 [Apium graveolens]
MDQIAGREKEFDLEAGVVVSEELARGDAVSGAKLARSFFTKLCKGFDNADRTTNVELELPLSNINVASAEKVISPLDIKVEIEVAAIPAENQTGKEKHKVAGATKSGKPPRPPRGLILNASDHKLVKEIAELAVLKKARIERMKALKKLKAAKASSSSGISSSGSMFSMLFTVIFCLVILFQGS